jgi:methionyl-tRNA formyltransferase
MVGTTALRIVFFGTPAFAVPTLDALIASRHDVVGVVTQTDRPRGRGQKVMDAPVKARAVAAGIDVLQPDRLRDPAFVDRFRAMRADLGVVAAYGRILTDEVLALPRLGMINVHASLLPKYRGAAPVHRAIVAGEFETGVTIMRVVKALDAGPMLAKVRRPIAADETSDLVERHLAQLGANLLVTSVDDLAAGRAVETPQDATQATYAHRLTKDDGIVDWTRSAGALHNQIRGLHPWPHAAAYVGGHRLILRRSEWPTATPPIASLPTASPPGTVVEAHGDRFLVATGNGVLRLVEMQPEGKRAMTAREFLAGRPVSVGDRFTAAP